MASSQNYYQKFTKLLRLEFFGWFIIFLISTGIVAIERFTPIYINNFYIRLFLYILSGSLFFFWLSWILFGFRAIKWRIFIFIGVAALCWGKAYLTWAGDWKTQIILYSNKNDECETIEYQMRGDRFAFGYKERFVDRKRIVPFVDYVTDIDTIRLTPEWHRADKVVNELGLRNYSGNPSR